MSERIPRRVLLQSTCMTVAGALLAACQPTAPLSASQTTAPKAEATEPAATANPAPSKVEVVLSTWGEGVYEPYLEKLNASQDKIHVTLQVIPWAGLREKMLTDIAAGQPSDVAEIDGYWMVEFMEKQVLQPLDQYLALDPALAAEKWVPNTIVEKFQTLHGQTFGLPNGSSCVALWYNVDIFAELGAKTPLAYEESGQWTWETLSELAQELSGGEGPNRRYGYQTWMGRADTDDIMRAYGGGWTNPEATEVWCSREESIEGLQLILDLHLKHKAAPLSQQTQAQGGVQQMFFTRHLAMYMSGIWEVWGLRQAEDLKYNIAPLPKGSNGRFMFYKPDSLTMPKGSKDPEAAWELLHYLKSPEMDLIWVTELMSMPFLKVNVEPFLTRSGIPNAQIFLEAFDKGWSHPMAVNANGAKMDQVVGDALGIALSEGKDAKWVASEVAPALSELVG